MSTQTPNFNLIKPDANDLFELFRQWYNDNLDIIDANLGGGGGSGGHTIIDQLGQNMPSRTGLQFIGATVTDDQANDKTVVTITGGGGYNYSTAEQVIGTWIDGKPIYQRVMTGLSIGQNSGTSYNIPIPSPDLEQIIDSTLMSTLTQYRTITHPPTWITNSSNLAIRSQEADTYDTFIIAYTKTTD